MFGDINRAVLRWHLPHIAETNEEKSRFRLFDRRAASRKDLRFVGLRLCQHASLMLKCYVFVEAHLTRGDFPYEAGFGLRMRKAFDALHKALRTACAQD